jgi:hypothetical protein
VCVCVLCEITKLARRREMKEGNSGKMQKCQPYAWVMKDLNVMKGQIGGPIVVQDGGAVQVEFS